MEETKHENKPLVFMFSTAAILILVVLATIIFYVLKVNKSSVFKTQSRQLDELTVQLNTPDLSPIVKNAEIFEKSMTKFSAFLARRVKYSEVLQKLQSLVPKDAKLSNLAIDDKGSVKLDGEAGSFSSLAMFIAALGNSNDFSDAKLISSTQSETTSGKRVSFALTFVLKK